jgi:RHS repeat-associated protein
VVERFQYDPYGEVKTLSASWSPTTDAKRWIYLFQGMRANIGIEENSAGSVDVYYDRNRYYLPAWGRFLTPDPTGYSDGMNLYQPFHDNPMVFGDPLGLFGISSEGHSSVADWGSYIGTEGLQFSTNIFGKLSFGISINFGNQPFPQSRPSGGTSGASLAAAASAQTRGPRDYAMDAFRSGGGLVQSTANYCSRKAGHKGGGWQAAADALTMARGIADAGAIWTADTANGLQDMAVGGVNDSPLGMVAGLLGYSIPSPDWSNGMVTGGEGNTAHNATKFLAANGLAMIVGGARGGRGAPRNRGDLHLDLRSNGFEYKGTSGRGYVTYKHPDGRIVTIKPSGEVIPTKPAVSESGKCYNAFELKVTRAINRNKM